jgi:hypothetical protein
VIKGTSAEIFYKQLTRSKTLIENKFLTKKQAIQKHPFLTENMLKNLLFKDVDGFRTKVVCRLGRRILLDENALIKFLDDNRG